MLNMVYIKIKKRISFYDGSDIIVVELKFFNKILFYNFKAFKFKK